MDSFAGNMILCFVAVVSAGVSVSCLMYAGFAYVRRWRLFSAADAQSTARFARMLRKGISPLLPIAHYVGKVKFVNHFYMNVADWLLLRGYSVSTQSVGSVVVALLLALMGISLLVTRSVIGVTVIPLCCMALLSAFLSAEKEKQQEDLRDAIPDVFHSMGSCFQSGLSLLQTFHQVSSESSGPVKACFRRAVYQLETGGTVEDSLALLQESESSELAFVAVALKVQHESGGSMQHVLDAARETVESQIDLARSLRVQTAQAKLSARVVSLMPFVLIALFSLVSPDFLQPFFTSSTGFVLLLLALLMQLAGVVLVRRMLAVEVV